MTTTPAVRSDRTAGVVVRVLCVVAASFAIGCLESWAQGFLPAALKPLSNSASGWTLVTGLLVFWSRAKPRMAAALGAASFVLLIAGYTVVSTARGFPYSPLLWGLVGLVVGPFVGLAAAWLHGRGFLAALGGGFLVGIGLGDALYGLTAVARTTGVAYWIGIGVLSLVLAGALLVGKVRGSGALVLPAVAVLTALVFAAALRVI